MFGIVIIEDEPYIRKSLITQIDWAGIGCTVIGDADNGDDALELIHQASPDIIISDIKMDGMDGIGISKYIHENSIDTEVILITGFAQIDYAQAAIKHGVLDFILKPIDPDELITAVKKAIREIDKRKQIEHALNSLKNLSRTSTAFTGIYSGTNCLVRKVLEYLYKNYDREFSLTELADTVNYNPKYISSLVRKETGDTITDILSKIRIEKAKDLMKDIGLKVYEIAYKVGINDSRYFSQLFRKITGETPSKYREKLF